VFAATAVVPEDPKIAARVNRWRFDHATDDARLVHARLEQRAAADGDPNPTRRALHALNG